MLDRVRSRLTYGNVMATIAVFIALGGTGYAAFKLPKNSVGPKQLKKNSVTGVKVKGGSLTGSDIRRGSLTGSDIKRGSLTGSDIRGGSLTGADVKASTLGTVPTASRAVTAGRADSAGDAATLQGLGPSAFVHGDGAVTSGRRDLGVGATGLTLLDIPGVVRMTAACAAGPEAELDLRNISGGTADYSFHSVGLGSEIGSLNSNGQITVTSSAPLRMAWEVATRGTPPAVATIVATISFSGPAACTTFAQATTGAAG